MKTKCPVFVFIIILLSSCSDPWLRYKILSTFFDGVPLPIHSEKRSDTKEKDVHVTEKRAVTKPAEHGPYAARMCYGCHKRDTNELVMPVEKLCLNCHEMDIKDKWVHGPISAGGCRVCHMPHSSGYNYMLVSEAKEFCLYCHRKEDIMKNQVHSAESGCLDCHDAHKGNDRFLLRD